MNVSVQGSMPDVVSIRMWSLAQTAKALTIRMGAQSPRFIRTLLLVNASSQTPRRGIERRASIQSSSSNAFHARCTRRANRRERRKELT
jgi:hypothetical protein